MTAVCPNGHSSSADDYCDTCGSPIDAGAQPAAGARGAGGAAPPAAPSGGSSLDLDPAPTVGGPSAEPAEAGGGTAPAALICPNCDTENADGALFCEACGYDFTTGAMPRAAQEPGPSPDGDGSGEPATPAVPGEAAGGSAGADPAGSAGTAGPDPADPTGSGPSPGSTGTTPAPASGTGFDWLAEVWIDPDWYKTQEADDPCPSPGLPTIVPLRTRSVLLGRVSTSRNTRPEIDLSSDPGVSRRHAQLTTDGTRWFVEDLGSSNGTFVGAAAGPLPDQALPVGPKTELDDDDRLYVGAWTRVVVRRATPDEVDAYA